MEMRRCLPVLVALLALAGPAAGAETIAAARYAEPVDRYGHFAPGRPHEYARLTATTSAGRERALVLPEDEVFEDVAPRLVRLAQGARTELLVIISGRDSGARLALVALRDGNLALSAQSPAIGVPKRWLNPVGVADLDGDGRAEIAAVITPHIGGTLKVYRREGVRLVEIAALAGFSNHVYGTPELALSAPVSVAGRMQLLVPDAQRRTLRVIALRAGELVETGRCRLPEPITGAITPVSSREIYAVLSSRRQIIPLRDCMQ